MNAQELQSLRNLGNECEEAADEIERLRAQQAMLVAAHEFVKQERDALRYAPTTQEPVETHNVGSGGYSVLDCPHCLRTIHIKTVHPPAPTQREHITDGSPCWCSLDLDYVDPETGAKVWIHKESQ